MNRIRLNFIQQRFWLDSLLKYPSSEYNDTNYIFVVQGNVSLSDLKEAYRLVMLEYPPYYSTIQVENGIPYFQFEEKSFQLPFEQKQVSPGEDIGRVVAELVNKPFDLQKEYPCRFCAIFQENKWYLVHVFHHVVMDGITLATFFERLSVVYNQLLSGSYVCERQVDSLLDFNRAFDSFYLANKSLHLDYWEKYVEDVPLHFTIPKIPVVFGKESEDVTVSYGFKLGTELQKKSFLFCKYYGTTPFRLYAAVWALTLLKLTNVNNFLLDHTLHLRPMEYASLLGTFVNNLPLHFNFEKSDVPFLDIINDLNRFRDEERKHQCVFYSDIVRQGNAAVFDRPLSINVGINYPAKYKTLALDFLGCNVLSSYHIDVQLSADLLLSIEDDSAFSCNIRHNPKLSKGLVKSMADTFGEIMRQVMAYPEIQLKDIHLVSAHKQAELLNKEEKALEERAISKTFLVDFGRSVQRFPHHIAVECNETKITYGELDRLSDRVAMALIGRNLSHAYIGLSMPKKIEMIIAILGILKSGNIYVPIDYNYPLERIHFIVKDCQVATVLTSKETEVGLSSLDTCFIEDFINDSVTDRVLPQVQYTDEAYVIYTSGTTGLPKGTPIKYSMLNQTIATNVEIQKMHENSRMMQFANIAFDASIVEIFPALAVGATLVLPQEMERKDPTLLLSFLKKQKITVANIPPSLLSILPHELLPQLVTIVIGGDSANPDAIQYWSANRLFINAYGPLWPNRKLCGCNTCNSSSGFLS